MKKLRGDFQNLIRSMNELCMAMLEEDERGPVKKDPFRRSEVGKIKLALQELSDSANGYPAEEFEARLDHVSNRLRNLYKNHS